MKEADVMKIVAFFSHAGGVGKTFTAINFATFLSRLGKTCVLLDADFEHPSIQTIMETGVARGFFDWTMSCITPRPWVLVDPAQVLYPSSDDLPSLHDCVSTQCATKLCVSPVKPLNRTSVIHVSPAWTGNRERNEILDSPRFHQLINMGHYGIKGVSGKGRLSDWHMYWRTCLDCIKHIEPDPEYIVIDVGSHALLRTILMCWLPITVVLLSRAKRREITPTLSYLEQLQTMNARLGSQNSVRSLPVLSMVPVDPSIDWRRDEDVQMMMRIVGKQPSDLHMLHYHHGCMSNEDQAILGLQHLPLACSLTYNLVRLFADLVHPDDLPTSPLKYEWLADLVQDIGLPQPEKEWIESGYV